MNMIFLKRLYDIKLICPMRKNTVRWNRPEIQSEKKLFKSFIKIN